MSHIRRTVAIASALAVLACAPTAMGAKPTKPPSGGSKSSCPTDLLQAFEPVDGDPALYFLSPGGDFEKKAWRGGALVADDDPFPIGTSSGTGALEIASSSSATSPATCIGLDTPTMRFPVKRLSTGLVDSLGLYVKYAGIDGRQHTDLFGMVTAPNDWVVTAPVPLAMALTALIKPTGTSPLDADLTTADVQFVFVPSPGSAWRVDDVYVDPYSRH